MESSENSQQCKDAVD